MVLAAVALAAGSACSVGESEPHAPPAPASDLPPSAGAPQLGTTRYDVPDGARFVAPSGDDRADGSVERPWRTLAHAVAASPPESTLVLRGGTYRESVQVYGKALAIQSYPGERVVLSGSDVVTEWSPAGDDFAHRGWTPSLPHTDGLSRAAPLAGWPELAFIDGKPQRQVASRAEVVPGTFFVDDPGDTVYLGSNPAGHTVELAARRWGLYLNGADGSSVRGIGIRHFATPIADVAALRAFSDDVVLQDLVVEGNAYIGISAMGSNVQVSRSTLVGNGQLGVHGLNADGLVVSRCLLTRNNSERFDMADQAGGLKVVRSRVLRFDGNAVRDNAGHGLWVDQSSYDVVMSNNVVQRNAAAGLHLEVSANAVLAGNAVTDNAQRGILIVESSDIDVWNNTALDNERDLDILDGPRTSSNLAAVEHDRRFPVPNPDIPWDVREVTVRNNVLGGGTSRLPIFRVDDVSHLRSFRDMGISSDHNAFYRRDVTAWLTLWTLGPTVLVAETLPEHQRVTGQDAQSGWVDGAENPWVTDPAAGDFRVPESAPQRLGAALPSRVASALQRPTGERPPIGVLRTPL